MTLLRFSNNSLFCVWPITTRSFLSAIVAVILVVLFTQKLLLAEAHHAHEPVQGKTQIIRFTSADYRGHPSNAAVIEGNNGLIYSLTESGVYEFSSSGSRRILAGNFSYGAFDANGDLWLGGFRSFGRGYTDHVGQWNFEDLYSKIDSFDVEGHLIHSILFHEGKVYVGSLRWVVRYDPKTREAEIAFDYPYIRKMFLQNGSIIPVGAESLLSIYHNGNLQPLSETEVLYEEDTPIGSGQMKNGDIVILTEGGNTWRFDGDKIQPAPFAAYSADKSYEVSGIVGTHSGTLLIATRGNGLWVLDNESCRRIDQERGLVNNTVNSVLSASNGMVWTAHNRGISQLKFPERAWFFGETHGLEGNISDVILTDTHAYVLTSVSAYKLDAEQIRNTLNGETSFDRLPFQGARTGIAFDNKALIGTGDGLMIATEEGWIKRGQNDCSIVMRSTVFPSRVYFGGYHGLYFIQKLANGEWGETHLIFDRINVVHGLGEAKNGDLWLRMGIGAVGRIEPPAIADDEWTFTEFGEAAGIPYQWINPLVIEGRCHIAADSLLVFDQDTQQFVNQDEWIYFGGPGPFSFTQEVWSESQGDLVAESDLIANLVPKPEGDHFESLNFFGEDIDNRASSFRESGQLRILGFTAGVVLERLDIESDYIETPLSVLLAKVESPSLQTPIAVNFDRTPWDGDPSLVNLPKGIRDLRFSFTTNQLFLSDKTLFHYYLRGYEQPSNQWVPNPHKEYTNLPPGQYTFVVEALDFQNRHAGPVEFHFHIPTPWYLTHVAYLLYFLGICLLVVISIRWRERHLRSRNKWLSRLVEDRTEEIRLQSEELLAKNTRLEEALEEARKLSEESKAASIAKSRFLASMSHEVRTPMNGVIGMCALLEQTTLDDQQHSFLQTIKSSGQHLLSILNDILDFSKIEAGKFELRNEPFCVRELAEGVISLLAPLAKEKEIDLSLYVEPGIRKHRAGDPARIRQILLNLVSNAIKFTENGFVRIRIRRIESEHQQDWLRFEIEDTGIGIPFDKQDQLFIPFSQVDDGGLRKLAGTGLGLSICKNLTEAMGGEMFVFSLPGRGTIFGLEIPAPELETTGAEKELPDLSGLRLRIASNDDVRAQILHSYLTDLNADATLTSNVEDLSKTNAALEQTDLWIIDHSKDFPNPEFLEFVDQIYPEIGILHLEDHIDGPRRHDHHVHMLKPFSYFALVHTCQAMIRKENAPFERNRNQAELKALSPQTAFEQLRVLIVEDNKVNQKVACLMLDKMGIRPELVSDGKQATEAVSKTQYDLILMDIQMPVMDGVEATQWIRKNAKYQPKIIALSAGVTEVNREGLIEIGMDGFVEKPINPDRLRVEMEKALGCSNQA